MIKKRSSVMLVTIGMLGMILLSGCGAGDGGDSPGPTPEPGQTVAASIELRTSNPQLDSDMAGNPTVTLTANVLDSKRNLLADKEVDFSADSGVLNITRGTTDATGTATATLSAGGDPTNRVINVTASTGSVIPANNPVTVTGTNLSISGAASLSSGDSTQLTIFLKDSKGNGVPGRSVTVTSAKGNTLSAASGDAVAGASVSRDAVTSTTLTTTQNGQAKVNVTATVGGADKITATAIGATQAFDLMVNTTILRFVNPSPTTVTEVPIGTNQPMTVEYINGTTPQAGVTVNFVTTRGVLSSSAAPTGLDGRATVSVSSTNSGPASLVAAVAGGPTSQTSVEFVAPTASKIDLQASPAVIGTNVGGVTTERSLITATVRDANDNLVKNKTVTFTIINDASAGSLSPASAITDSFGSAFTYFIAGASSGGLGGVAIRASVVGTAVTATTTLTVAKKALFISLSTGPTITKVNPNMYRKDYVALVTDSAGNPVAGATIVSTVTPMHYRKGYYRGLYRTSSSGDEIFVRWVPVETLEPTLSTLPGIPACANEDGMLHNPLYDYNGILDPGEDQNGNNRLDPGNVASVTPVTTDSTGHGTVSIVYARDYAYWVNVRLEAFANDLKGSTASAEVIFDLSGAGEDYTDEKTSPPGDPSPFGTLSTCYVDLTVTTVSSSQLSISWQRSPIAARYNVYRNGVFIAGTTQTTYFDSGLSHGTLYCYEVRIVDMAGIESAFTGMTCNATAVLPPSNLTATAISPSQIRLTWSALAGATGYRIYQNGGFSPIRDVVSTSAVISGLAANSLYCFAVSGNNAAGVESPQSGQVCATTQLSAPPTPTGLAATGSIGPPPTVTLTWNASAGATKYNIYRDGRITPAFSVNAPGVRAVDTGLDIVSLNPKTNYCYTISAEDVTGNESAQSTQVCTATGGAPPPAPTGLTATQVPGPRIQLNWSASPGAVGYRVYRTESAGAGTAISMLIAAPQTTVTDTTVAPNTGYCYVVSALDGSENESARSSQVCILTGGAPPPIPTNLTATVSVPAGVIRVTLNWSDPVDPASYRIYRDGGTLPLLTVNGLTRIATDETVSANSRYCYTVSSVSSTGDESAQSASACVNTPSPPPATPTNLSVTAISPTQIQVSWTGSAVGYRVYRDTALRASVTSTTYTDTGLTPNTVYCYAVSSINATGVESERTVQLCATTHMGAAPPTPVNFSAAVVVLPGPPPSLAIELSWFSLSLSAVNDTAFYNVYKKIGTGPGTFVLLRAVPGPPGVLRPVTTVDTPVTVGTSYCYTVSAVSHQGNESPQTQQICRAP